MALARTKNTWAGLTHAPSRALVLSCGVRLLLLLRRAGVSTACVVLSQLQKSPARPTITITRAESTCAEERILGRIAVTVDAMLDQAIMAFKAGRKTEARQLLGKVLALDSENETAWLWLSGAVDTREERIACLENVLSINSDNNAARRGLESLGVPLKVERPGGIAQAAKPRQSGLTPPPTQTGVGSGLEQSATLKNPADIGHRSPSRTGAKTGAQSSVDTLLKAAAALAIAAVAAIFGFLVITWVGDSIPDSVAANAEPDEAAHQPDWQQIGSQDGRFAIMMPDFPEYGVQDVLTPVGALQVHIFSVSVDDSVFMAAYNDYPEFIVSSSDAGKMLDGARDGAVSNVNGKLLSERQIRLQGHPGRELWIEADVEGQEGLARARIYLVGRRLYQVLVAGPENQFPESDAERCLDSFLIVQ